MELETFSLEALASEIPHLPLELSRFVEGCLADEYFDRFVDADDLREGLRDAHRSVTKLRAPTRLDLYMQQTFL